MLRLFSPVRLLVAGLLVAAVAVTVWIYPTESYIFLPNRAHPVAPLVEVEGGKNPKDGGIFFVDVLVRKATLARAALSEPPRGRDGRSSRAGSATGSEREPAAERGVAGDADVAAGRGSGRAARARLQGRRQADRRADRVRRSEAPAAGKLLPGDVVTSAGGKPVEGPAGSVARSGERNRDETSQLDREARRRAGRRSASGPTRGPQGTPVIGVIVSQAADIKLPVDVEIDTNGVGGPSAGLAFALDLMEELGHDVDHGEPRRRDRRTRARRDGRRDRRRQAEDDRGRARRDQGLPRSGWGKRSRGEALCGWDPDRACDQFSTGVAEPGNIAACAPRLSRFRHLGMGRKVHRFHPRSGLQRPSRRRRLHACLQAEFWANKGRDEQEHQTNVR